MKKLFTLLLALMLTLSTLMFTACTENPNNDNRPVLKVAMECAYQPYNWTQFTSDNGAVAIKGNPGQYANGYDVKIAQKIADYLDMKQPQYSRYERGVRDLPTDVLIRLAKLYKTSTDYILGMTNNSKPYHK